MIDIAVIGSGPAGLSAAINARARNKNVVIFGNKIDTSALFKAKKVDNHLGFFDINGKEMFDIFFRHIQKFEIPIKTGRVTQILPLKDFFAINFENEIFNAKTVVLAVGSKKSKKLDGEEKFIGSGVSYCATCDGMFYKNKSVVVIADNLEAESDVKFLSEICKDVKYIPSYQVQSNFSQNVEILNFKPKKILGDKNVEAVETSEKEIPCNGVFILQEFILPSNIIFGLEMQNNFVKIDRACKTNLSGIFAAGDCTGWPLQLSKAIGEGQIAAQSAARFIDSK